MKKISNWVFGSFFRTMGRFFFFLFFGFLLANILSRSEIKWTDLLGIETIKADSYYRAWDTVWYDDENLTQQWTSGTTFVYKTFQSSATFSNLSLYKNYSSNKINMDDIKGGHITIPFVIDFPMTAGINGNNSEATNLVCTRWTQQSSGVYACTNYDDESFIIRTQDYEYIPPTIQMNVFARYTSGYIDVCEIDYNKNYITCPVINSTGLKFDGITYAIKVTGNGITTNYRLGLGLKINGWSVDGKNIQDAVESQTNQTISTITDSNTTEATSEANNFFESFTSQDNGGISSIITAPLSAISGLASATCSPITLPIPYLDNKQLVLPCMSAIYTEHFGSFFSLYQTIIFGVIAYRMLVSIFMMIQGFKNPDDDKIEVVDL